MRTTHLRSLRVDDPEWNRVVRTASEATVYHHPGLLAAAAAAEGHQITGLGAWMDNQLIGGVIVMYRPGTAPGPVSRQPFNGPLILPVRGQRSSSSERRRADVFTSLLNELRHRFGRPRLRLPADSIDLRPALVDGWTAKISFSFEVDISDLSQAWGRFDHDRRRLIRRAERLGYHVTEVEPSSIDSDAHVIARLHHQQQLWMSGRGAGDPAATTELGRQTAVVLGGLLATGAGRAFIAVDADGTPVAAQVVATMGDRAGNLITGIDPAHRDSGVNGLLRWQSMSALHLDGISRLDLNGARQGETGRFKASFGGRLTTQWIVSVDDQRTVADSTIALARRIRSGLGRRARAIIR